MCLPSKTDQPPSTPAGSGGTLATGMGGLMLLACLGGPALIGALGGLGAGVPRHRLPADAAHPKAVVGRLIDEVINAGRLDLIDELYTPQMAPAARRWITPFRDSFPDVRMEIIDLIAEGEKVVGRFHCSATNLGPWRGQPPTGRRFERVDEVYIFRIHRGRIAEAWGLEDTRSRERQLGHSQ